MQRNNMLYHRLSSPSQTSSDAAKQIASQEMWGRPSRYSEIPKVKAYRGALPPNALGIEFITNVEPDAGSPPMMAYWTGGRENVRLEDGIAKISVEVTYCNSI
jgi:hypothetical protein